MKLNFTKMHGCGNDYIYINGAECGIPAQDKPELVQTKVIGGAKFIMIRADEGVELNGLNMSI